ncbi:MAG: YdcF family protein [Geobacteraceae bacterium]|nr:YdcF family protein [Geobacteraceae bacterium]
MLTLLKGLISCILLLSLLVFVLFVDFVYKTFSYSVRDINPDAVVVLAGGKGRIEEGVKLYREGRGNTLFLIGVDPSVKKADLYKEVKGLRSSEQVILENVSRNTLENAIFARELIVKNGVRSMILITSRYHMKRSLLIFRNILPKDIAIYPHPVIGKSSMESLWSHGGSMRLLFSEFYKYCLYRTVFLFSQGELRYFQ